MQQVVGHQGVLPAAPHLQEARVDLRVGVAHNAEAAQRARLPVEAARVQVGVGRGAPGRRRGGAEMASSHQLVSREASNGQHGATPSI